MRFLARCLGLLLAAAAFVAVVIDGTRSIADNTLQIQPTGAIWVWLNEPSLVKAQEAMLRNFSPAVWENLVVPLLSLPFFAVLMLLAAVFLWLGRRPHSPIGHATYG